MAVQLSLGLLSERRIGTDRRDYHHSSGIGPASVEIRSARIGRHTTDQCDRAAPLLAELRLAYNRLGF
jgi:hypothetical protein